MKYILGTFLSLWLATSLFAQTNVPLKLALIAESDDAAAAVDVLTAQLSSDSLFQLLDRDEIDKVYHEQGLAAANRNDLKLGRILGADGLLILNTEALAGPAHANSPGGFSPRENLMIRLIAVKPGVILSDGSFTWPQKDPVSWAQSAADYLDLFVPKLNVRTGEAIPISIINLRSAIQTSNELELEQQIKLLTIQRLSQEPRFFVLEREKMQLLGEEKNLQADESAFWDGSYLLEGTIDQNGYSRDTVTINARLNPPKGGAPILFEVMGSRANLAEVINALATNVTRSLNIQSTLKEWNASDEAAQYFNEANWALKWGVFSEAEGAADSAWALGKQDLDCATVRVKAYIMDTLARYVPFEEGTIYVPDDQSSWKWQEQDILKGHVAALFDRRLGEIDYSTLSQQPKPASIKTAIHALELYYNFSRSSTNGLALNSDWYRLGIDDLVAASKILQDFNFAPRAQAGVEDQLADLRAIARSVASLIDDCPSVHESFFGPDAALPDDEYAGAWYEKPNIFICELKWGCFWQETPRDEMALYEYLMSSRIFGQAHEVYWFRPADRPLLVGWTDADRENLPATQNQFLQELDSSTNSVEQLESRAIRLRYATGASEAAAAITNLFETLIACRCALITNHVDWGLGDLTAAIYGSKNEASWSPEYQEVPQRAVLLNICSSFSDRLRAEDEKAAKFQEEQAKLLDEQKDLDVLEKQKRYLENQTPYNFFTFIKVFQDQNYTKVQAGELLALIGNYKSNMIAQASGRDKFLASGNAQFIDTFLGIHINQILNAPPAQPAESAAPRGRAGLQTAPAPVRASPAPAVFEASSVSPEEIPSNILRVTDFIKIPEQKESNDMSGDRIFARRWSDGKLLFGLVRDREVYDFDTNGNWIDSRGTAFSKIAIFNPANQTWDFVKGSEVRMGSVLLTLQDNNNRIILFHGQLYSSVDGPIKKFDFPSQDWQTLDIPVQDGSDLFSVGDHLYAANDTSFLDITDPGNVRILASTRRRPAVTALDSLDTFAVRSDFSRPQLFDGPEGSLCASVGSKIYRWDGKDWQEILNMNISRPPEVFDGGVILRDVARYGSDDRSSLWLWDKSQDGPKLCLSDKPQPHPGIINSPFLGTRSAKLHPAQQTQPVHAQWESLPDDYLTSAVATIYDSDFYFLVDHADVKRDNSGHWNEVDKNGYDAKLVCLTCDLATPVVVPLKFDTTRAQPPLRVLGKEMTPELMFDPSALDATLHFAGNSLYFNQRNLLGVWAIPASELESAIAAVKQTLIARIAQEKAEQQAAKESVRRRLLAKYDRNHNGTIDPDEREEALDDPDYIESELDKIDANHDGLLEANELSWFDANQNKILDPKEAGGINIAQHLLAIRLMKKFDADGKGYLSQSEFSDLKESCTGVSDRTFFVPQLPGRYLGPRIDLQGVEDFLKGQTARSLRLPGSNAAIMNQLRASAGAVDKTQVLKLEVEYYWAHSGGQTH